MFFLKIETYLVSTIDFVLIEKITKCYDKLFAIKDFSAESLATFHSFQVKYMSSIAGNPGFEFRYNISHEGIIYRNWID